MKLMLFQLLLINISTIVEKKNYVKFFEYTRTH